VDSLLLTWRIIVVLDATVREEELAGSISTVLARNVRHLDPQAATFDAMLGGWERQQRARFLKASTVRTRHDMVRRFARFTNEYPWQWLPADVEAFIVQLRSAKCPIAPSTARGYQNALRLFVEYVTDARYGWPQHCLEHFGAPPTMIVHEWNTVAHVTEYEGDPRRRPLTYDEVQALFDAAESVVEDIRARGRKGALAAQRDAVLLKTIYAFGLRRREAWGLDLADLRHNPQVTAFGRIGGVFVRWGKSSKGSQPKRRTVYLVPEMDWLVQIVEQWLDELRPAFGAATHQALWLTERMGRLSLRSINEAFANARTTAGLPAELDLHCLRHSYITHLTEFGYPEKFVQDQAGHAFASTTAIYTGVSDEYRNRLLLRSLEKNADRWEAVE
jgi:site-specific recombinase XerD